MVKQLGPPDLFLTLSLADNRLLDLKEFYNSLGISTSGKSLYTLNAENPMYQVIYSKIRLETFISKILPNVINYSDHYTVFELQGRGSLHTHSLLWLNPDEGPTIRTIDMNDQNEISKLNNYFSHMMTAMEIENHSDTELEHPTSKTYSNRLIDLSNCVNKLQVHEHTDYCLDKSGNCRFGHDKLENNNEAQTIIANEVVEFKERRNNPKIVTYNETLLRAWRCNINLKVVNSNETILAYMTKYLSGKGQPDIMQIFADVFEKHQEKETNVYRIIMDIMMSNMTGKLITIQEIFTRLLSQDLCQFSRTFERIDVNSKILQPNGKTKEPEYITAYLKRNQKFENYSLYEFMKKVAIKKKNKKFAYTMRQKEPIITFGIQFVSKSDPGFKEYAQNWCLYFTAQNEKFRIMEPDESVEIYNSVVNEAFSGKDPVDYQITHRKLRASDDILDNPINDVPVNPVPEVRDVIQMDGAQGQEDYAFEPEIVVDNLIHLSNDQISQLERVFKSLREESKDQTITTGFKDRLNQEQKIAFEIMTKQENKKIILNGKAGSGKSFIINALREHYGRQIVVSAPTGVAAHNVGAVTIHTLLHFAGNHMPEMTAINSIQKFQEEFEEINVLIIDEYTMMGAQMLCWVDTRLQLAKNNSTEFGGIKLILCGDPRQLPQVKAKVLWGTHTATEDRDVGYGIELYKSFKCVVVLKQSMRQENGSEFAQICNRIGDAKMISEDYNILKELQHSNHFENSIKLCCTRLKAKQINDEKLQALTSQKKTIKAVDTFSKTKRKPEEEIHGLRQCLEVKVGSQVMLTSNLNVKTGLVNGATGIVRGLYINSENECIGALVEFKNYSGIRIGQEFAPNHVPIFKIEKFERGIRRKMLPLVLSWGMTVHKSQGLTLEKIDLFLEDKEYTPGLTFVGVSRVKSLHDIRVHDMTRKRLEALFDDPKVNKPAALLEKLNETRRLEDDAERTLRNHLENSQ